MLVGGQRIASYAIDALVAGAWQTLPAVDKSNNGVHGETVGIRIVDFISPAITATKLRWRCLSAIGGPSSDISIRSITARHAAPPAGCASAALCNPAANAKLHAWKM